MKDLNMSFAIDAGSITLKKLLKREYLELQMKAISSANPNRNKSWFTPESMVKALPTFANKPILGCFVDGDFDEHNGTWKKDSETSLSYWDTLGNKGERILGTIRESDPVNIIQDEEGLSWITLSCVLWVSYAYKQVKRLIKDAQAAAKSGNPTKNISVEVIITDWEELENGVIKINDFKLRGITILGSHVKPGIAGAELSLSEFEETESFSQQQKELQLAYAVYEGQPQEDIKEENDMPEDLTKEGAEVTPAAEPTAEPAAANMSEELCPECGKNPCECHNDCHNEDGKNGKEGEEGGEGEKEDKNCNQSLATPEANPEAKPEDNGATLEQSHAEDDDKAAKEAEARKAYEMYDIAYLLEKKANYVREIENSLMYYSAEWCDLPHKDLIVAVLKKMLNHAVKDSKDLADLNDKILGEGITEDYAAQVFKMAENWDSEVLLEANEKLTSEKAELETQYGELNTQFSAQKEKIEKYEHDQFTETVKGVLAKFNLEEDFVKEIITKCNNKEFADVDAVKNAIALHIGFASMKKEEAKASETAEYSAPASTPTITAPEAPKAPAAKKGCWDTLMENYKEGK